MIFVATKKNAGQSHQDRYEISRAVGLFESLRTYVDDISTCAHLLFPFFHSPLTPFPCDEGGEKLVDERRAGLSAGADLGDVTKTFEELKLRRKHKFMVRFTLSSNCLRVLVS